MPVEVHASTHRIAAPGAVFARRFAASIAPATGLSIPVRVGTTPGATGIVVSRNARLTRLGDEGYEVTATTRLLTIGEASDY